MNLFETIRLQDGVLFHLPYHQRRLDRAFQAHFPGASPPSLETVLPAEALPSTGVFKVRFIYSDAGYRTEWVPYEMRAVRRLKVVHNDEIAYAHKYQDRASLDALFRQRGTCDEVIIVCAGKVTDASVGNLAFRKKTRWYTPNTPLLPGTMRSWLLETGLLTEQSIREDEIMGFDACRVINAMIGFEMPEVPTSNIVF